MKVNAVWNDTKAHFGGAAFHGHFRFTVLSTAVILLALVAAVAEYAFVAAGASAVDLVVLAGATVVAAVMVAAIPYWPVALVAIVAVWAVVLSNGTSTAGQAAALGIVTLGLMVAPSLQIAKQWQRAVVLRLGRFRSVFGPGPYAILPFADAIVRLVDMRIRVTDFSAEKSITRDTVPVHVDALAFWMVWDAEKAVLEVESYVDAVTLSAQTALRDAIGRNDLATLLSERERLGSEIQTTLDTKTNPWGITILSIEFKEVLVPKELEDALSRKAQAERERQSRVILGSAEVEIAHNFEKAAESYRGNPTALQLRVMNMVYDSIRTNKNIVLMPSSALDSMNLGAALGATAFLRSETSREQGIDQAEGVRHEETARKDAENQAPGAES